MSFNSEMTNLADAIRAKSGVSGKLTIAGMTSAVEGIELGGGGSTIEYGYINADGKVQKLDLSGDAPVNSGTAETMAIHSFLTGQPEPDYGGGGSGSGTFDLAKITKYSASPFVLKGVLATGYSDEEWSFESAEQSFTGFEETPKIGFIYAVAGDRLVGSTIGCPYPVLLMPLNGNLSATSYGEAITPQVDGTLTFDTHGAKFTGNQYIDLPIDVGFFAKNATICFRMYQTGSGRYGYVAGTEDCYLGIDSNGGVFSLWAGQGGSWNIFDSDGWDGRSEVEIPRNTEVHVAYIHNADTGLYQLAINGDVVKEISETRSIAGGVNLRFGAWGNGGYRFVGSMRDIRVYDKALSVEELQELANS